MEDRTIGASFHEAAHLEDDTDMVAAISTEESRHKALRRDNWQIPVRPITRATFRTTWNARHSRAIARKDDSRG